MKRKLTYGLIALTALGTITGGVLISEGSKQVTKADINGYTCAYLDFGTGDFAADYANNLGTATYLGSISVEISATTSNLTTYGEASGISVSSWSTTKVYCKTGSKYPLKLGSGSAKGIVSFTFDSSIVGATIYAASYGSDATVLQVGSSSTSTADITLTKSLAWSSTASSGTFGAYYLSLNSTNTLYIAAKNIKNNRYFISHISLRLA